MRIRVLEQTVCCQSAMQMIMRAIWIFLGIYMAWGSGGCKPSNDETKRPVKSMPRLRVGIQVSPAMTLVMVAEDKGFFDEAGVDVEIVEFTAGKFALQAFLGGSLDAAISGDVPVALSVLQGNELRVITQVVERTINECRVVARSDRGIDSAEAYFRVKKRKIATSFGGGPEFFTSKFLEKHGISLDNVELISQKPEDMPAALVSGTVDAIAIFDPQARIAEKMMGDQGVSFVDKDIYSEIYVVAVSDLTLESKSEELISFLRALRHAHVFIITHPEESKNILMRYTQLERQLIDDIWGNFVFRPSLNSLFLEYTHSEAEWAINKGTFPPDTPIPDYRAILHCELLRRVDPSAVMIPPAMVGEEAIGGG